MKNVLYSLMLMALLLLPARPAHALEGHFDGRVVIGQDFTLRSGDTVNGDLVVIGAEAIIENNAQVDGDIVVIGGSLNLNGRATGNAVVIGGLVSVADQASVGGDVVTIGGSLQRAEGAHIGGNVVTNLPPPMIPLPNTPSIGSPAAPPGPAHGFNLGILGTVVAVFFQAIGLAA
jgi:NDP-sugar pyrophosphorylase family protein